MSPEDMRRGLQLASAVFSHHDRYGQTSVVHGQPDVFAVERGSIQDVAVRIDAGYAVDAREMHAIVTYWAEIVRDLGAFLRIYRDDIWDDQS